MQTIKIMVAIEECLSKTAKDCVTNENTNH